LGLACAAAAVALLALALRPAELARGKTGAAPLPGELTPEQAKAQALALADARVVAHTSGRRAEVFGVRAVGRHAPASSAACAEADCRQVEIYLYDENATVLAIVNLSAGTVIDVFHQPGVQPGINPRVADLAAEIARNSPELIVEAGLRPARGDLVPMVGGVPGTACDDEHLCLAMTIDQGTSLLWAVVDVTEERLAGLSRTPIPAEAPGTAAAAASGAGGLERIECPAAGSADQYGWHVNYHTTGSDGLRIYDVTHWGVPVITSASLPEWHVDYGSNGFVDPTGCLAFDGGFYVINPFGQTVVRALPELDGVPGFEVVQDFRMSNWGAACNYRYGQSYQFYADGRFRAVGVAYGRGCSNNGMYRPVMRIDLAVAGDAGDSVEAWNGAAWAAQATEAWWPQMGPYADGGFLWRVSDAGGRAYYVEPGQGQFGDGGRGDNAWLYAVRHKAAEGDMDLGILGNCCRDDYRQGPEEYINAESIQGENVVLWYAAQQQTVVEAGNDYCWTVRGEPNAETYPCAAGPMLAPTFTAYFTHTAPAWPGQAVLFANKAEGSGPLSYGWDFGDGLGTAGTAAPTYTYTAEGTYTVTLTVTDTVGSATYTDTVWIGQAPVAGFAAAPVAGAVNTLQFTNTTTGTAPVGYLWTFGDGITSTVASPVHMFANGGTYTVTLTATNPISSSSASQVVYLPVFRRWLPWLERRE
jgi:hypothetical protein